MDHLAAFELPADLQGTVDVDGEEVPKYGGGVLYIGDGDFHVRDELDAGHGVIVCQTSDSLLVEMLDAYPGLKRAAVPEKPSHVVSPYARRTVEDLRAVASLRDLEGAGTSREQLTRHLEAHDAALRAGDQALAEAVRAGDDAAVAHALGGKPNDGLGSAKTEELEALAQKHDVSLEGAANNADRVERLRAAGVRKEG